MKQNTVISAFNVFSRFFLLLKGKFSHFFGLSRLFNAKFVRWSWICVASIFFIQCRCFKLTFDMPYFCLNSWIQAVFYWILYHPTCSWALLFCFIMWAYPVLPFSFSFVIAEFMITVGWVVFLLAAILISWAYLLLIGSLLFRALVWYNLLLYFQILLFDLIGNYPCVNNSKLFSFTQAYNLRFNRALF